VTVLFGPNLASGQDAQPVSEGLYTDPQADRGEREFGRSCEHCHGKAFEGDVSREVPALTGDAFVGKWKGRPLKELSELLRQSMPADNRGKLNARAYVELVAFLLKVNGFQSGATDLSAVVIDTATIGAANK
jgi:mono/diheme cytochrome c family protein